MHWLVNNFLHFCSSEILTFLNIIDSQSESGCSWCLLTQCTPKVKPYIICFVNKTEIALICPITPTVYNYARLLITYKDRILWFFSLLWSSFYNDCTFIPVYEFYNFYTHFVPVQCSILSLITLTLPDNYFDFETELLHPLNCLYFSILIR